MFDGMFVAAGWGVGGVINGIIWCLFIACAIKCCVAICGPRWRED